MTLEEKILVYQNLCYFFPREVRLIESFAGNLMQYSIKKLSGNTVGNGEVYSVCLFGDACLDVKEFGFLFLFPDSGIKTHEHPSSVGISEVYTSFGPNSGHFDGEEFLKLSCSLDNFHGIDIENTFRCVSYDKTNHLLKGKNRKLLP